MSVETCARCTRSDVALRSRDAAGGRLCSNCAARANSGVCEICDEFRRFDGFDAQGRRWCERCRKQHARSIAEGRWRDQVIATITAADPVLGRDVIDAVVADVARHPRTLRGIARHLDTHPDVLTIGPTSTPGCIDRLVTALIAAGATRIRTIHPTCIGCGRQRRPHERRDDGTVCSGCWTRDHHAVCCVCGTDRRIATRDHHGNVTCVSCSDKARNAQRRAPIDTMIITAVHTHDPLLDSAAIAAVIDVVAATFPKRRTLADAIDHGPPLSVATERCAPVARFLNQLRQNGSILPAAICPACQHPANPLVTHRLEVRCRPCATTCSSCTLPVNDPDKILCSKCATTRARPRGDCTGCPRRGVLLDTDRHCRACRERVIRVCHTCHTQTELTDHHGNRCCHRCVIADEFDALTGTSPPPWLQAIRAALVTTSNAETTRLWIKHSAGGQLLARLAAGEFPVSHETLDAHPGASIDHLRGMLINVGALTPDNRRIDSTEQQLADLIAAIAHADDKRTVTSWARWEALPKLRRRTTSGASTEHSAANLRRHTRQIVAFITFVNEHGRTLATCAQTDIDHWFAQPGTAAQLARSFLTWAIRRRHLTGVELPPARQSPPTTIDSEQRWEHARRLVNDTTIRIDDRFAGALVVLYAQPTTRIAALTTGDLNVTDTTTLTIAGTTIELPEPFATLSTQLPIRRRGGLSDQLATPWLFPASRPGGHVDPQTIANRLRKLGIQPRAMRLAALSQLAADIPPAILAPTIGINPGTAARWATLTGGNWTNYTTPR